MNIISNEVPRSVPDQDNGWPCASGQHDDCVGLAIEGVFAECPCLCHQEGITNADIEETRMPKTFQDSER